MFQLFFGSLSIFASPLRRARLVAVVLLASSVFSGATCAEERAETFYQGKKTTMLIGSSPGGGYDVYARIISRYMPKHIPGEPSMVASNMAGAGSNIAAAYIASSAPKDGTYIGALYMGAVVEPLFYGKKRSTHNPAEFQYVGNANTDYNVCAIRADAPVKTFDELFKTEIVLGASAPGGATYDFPIFLKQLLGIKIRLVSGYPGSREVNLALEKGEVQGVCGQSWGGVAAMYEPMIRNGSIRLIAQESGSSHPDLAKMGVPLARDFAKTEAERKIMDLFYEQTSFSRPYVVAKETPAARVAILRAAFMKTMQDPELVAEAKRLGLEVEATSGDDLQKKITKIYSAPAEMVEQIRAIYVSN